MALRDNGDSAVMFLFGSTGDLARRKLYPALFHLYRDKLTPETFAIVGLGRRPFSNEQYHDLIKQSLQDAQISAEQWEGVWPEFSACFRYFRLDVEEASDYAGLLSYIEETETNEQIMANRLFYLAIAPELFESVTYHLQQSGLLEQEGWKRLIIEKPFGKNEQTAEKLNQEIKKAFNEEEIYRIDHYLGKEMVQNIEVIRMANSFFEPVWNSRYISNVQITSSEFMGVEGRAAYYDKAGAMQDMVQNHILQMVSLVAMEPPSRLHPEAIRDEKVKVLQSIRKMHTAGEVDEHVVRGQYLEGEMNGESVLGYRQEANIRDDSSTETFIAAKLWVDNFRWAQVPFFIRTGKRLAQKSTEIVIQFKELPNLFFNTTNDLEPNLLVIRIYPEEGIHLTLNAKKPGSDDKIVPITMNFCQSDVQVDRTPDAYERLIHDCLQGDSTYFTRWDEVSLSWKIIDPITNAWINQEDNLFYYRPGQWGPEEAHRLIESENLRWWPVSGISCSR